MTKEKEPEPITQPEEEVKVDCTEIDCDDCGAHFHKWTCMDVELLICVNQFCSSRDQEVMNTLNTGEDQSFKPYGMSPMESIVKRIMSDFPNANIKFPDDLKGYISFSAKIQRGPEESIKAFHERANKIIQDKLKEYSNHTKDDSNSRGS